MLQAFRLAHPLSSAVLNSRLYGRTVFNGRVQSFRCISTFQLTRSSICQVHFKDFSSDEDSYSQQFPAARTECVNLTLIQTATKFVIASLIASLFSASLYSGIAYASSSSVAAPNLGLRIAGILRKSGWADEAIVFTLATLPVLELRGAIPVGNWMQLDPLKVYVLSVLGNMVPVPIVLLYLERISIFLSERSSMANKFLNALYSNTRKKAGPIEEFKWLGLMLFVAVPFPGTGAWTGAIAAVILGMPFWSSFWANFLGVVIAGILVDILVHIGLRYALVMGSILFLLSTFMWSFIRCFRNRK